MISKFIKILIFTILLIDVSLVYGVNYTWTGSISTAWNNSGNWSPSGIPDSADNVTIVSTTNDPVLDQNRMVSNFTISNGTLDLNGFIISINGDQTYFTSGIIQNGRINITSRRTFFDGTNFDCYVNALTGTFNLNGGQFDLPVSLQDTGYTNSTGNGGCVFNDSLTIIHGGDNWLQMAKVNGDVYNGPVTITNHSINPVYLAYSDTSYFNANLKISNTSTGGYIFGHTGGVSILASGKTISIGPDGFDEDILILQKFKQLGSTSQNLILTDTAYVSLTSCEFNGNLTITAPGILLKNNVLNGPTTLTRNGNILCDSYGGNVFNDAVTIANSGNSGRIRLATTAGDTFNSDVTFNSSGQDFQVAYRGLNYFYGNITANSDKVVFNVSTGSVIFSGGLAQSLSSSHPIPFEKITMNKTANHVTINTAISIDDSLNFISGNIITTSANVLTMKSGSLVVGASNRGFVSGPCIKYGNTAFVFPIGKNSIYTPLEITAPSPASTYIAEYFDSIQNYGSTFDTSLSGISSCEYWTLARTTGIANVKIKLNWNSGSCNISYPTSMRVANWNGTKWVNLGQDTYGGSLTNGYVKGLNNPTSFSAFCIANTAGVNHGHPQLGVACDFALLAEKDIISDYLSIAVGKIGSKQDTSNVSATDSILTFNSGSVSAALDSVQNIISYLNGLSDTTISNNIGGLSFSSGIYSVSGNVNLSQNLTLVGDSTSLFVFNIAGDMVADSGASVTLNGVYANNVYWNISQGYQGNSQIKLPGIVFCKQKAVISHSHFRSQSIFSLDSILLFSFEFDAGNNLFTSPCSIFDEFNSIGGGNCTFNFDQCNLIRNSSFDQNAQVPSTFSFLNFACPWDVPINSTGTPDYFNSSCPNLVVDIPLNWFGCQADFSSSGIGYGGLFARSPNNYREYMQQQLQSTLIANTVYYSEMFVSMRDDGFSSNSIGMIYSPAALVQPGSGPITPPLNSNFIQSDPNVQLSDFTNWTRVAGCFTAIGIESFVTIGNFNNNLNTTSLSTPNAPCNTNVFWPGGIWPYPSTAYYFIDEPRIVPFTVNAGPDQTVNCDETVQLGLATCLTPLNTGQFTYLWTELSNPLGATLSDYSIYNPTVTFANSTGTTVTQVYSVTITSPGGCSTTDIVEIIVESCGTEPCDDGISYCFFDYIVSGSEVWESGSHPGFGFCSGNNITIEHELRIPAGTELTIKGLTVRFGPFGKIIVERGIPATSSAPEIEGGRLHVIEYPGTPGTPTRLLPASDECMWQGIEVWGYRNFSQIDPKQGILWFEDSEISYAHCAIFHGRRNDHLSNRIVTFNGGVTELVARSLFKDNYVGIHYPTGYSMNFGSVFNISHNDFVCESSLRDPIYSGERTLYFIDINRRRPIYSYDPNNGTGNSPTIVYNTFHNTPTTTSNSTIAIRCNSSRGIPFLDNEFIDVDRGIMFVSDNGAPGAGNIVTESNYFKNVNIGIYNRNNQGNILFGSEMENGLRGHNQGIFNEFSVGTLIQNNSIDYFLGGINVSKSGINQFLPIRIWDNYIDNTNFSLLASGDNKNSDWWCNNLFNYNSGFAWTLFDIGTGGGTDNARIRPQGVCGGLPAGNSFNITSPPILDINNLTNSTNNFIYNIRTGATTTVFEPDPVSGLVTVNVCAMPTDETTTCSQLPNPFRIANELLTQRDTTTDSTFVSILNAEIYNYYIRVNEIDSAISFIDTIEVEGIEQILLDLYFMKEDVESTRNLISGLPSSTQEEVDYIRFMHVMVDLMEDSLTVFEMDSSQLASIAELSLSDGTAAMLSQGILNTIYAKPLIVSCEMVNACEESRFAQLVQNNKSLQLLHNYPNPCNQSTTFEIPEEANEENGLKLKIFNRLGKLIADLPVFETSKIEYDCSSLSDGLYLYYFQSANFKSAAGKLVVIKD